MKKENIKSKLESLDTIVMGLYLIVAVIALSLGVNIYYQEKMNIDDTEWKPDFVLSDINFSIHIDGLEKDEIDKALETVSDIKEEYMLKQELITFTKNISRYMKKENLEKDWNAFNRNKGLIFILYTDEEKELRRRLCHELLHTFIIYGNESHQIVYDLDDDEVCYEE